MIKKLLAISATLISASLIASNAYPASQVVTSSVNFIAPLSITNVINADFGSVSAGVAATTYVLDTSGNITTATGPGISIAGTPTAASFTISGSTTQTISISAGGYTTSNGVVPSAATCKYGALAAMSCGATALKTAAAPGTTGTTMAIGLSIAAPASVVAGTVATPSFTMTIAYN